MVKTNSIIFNAIEGTDKIIDNVLDENIVIEDYEEKNILYETDTPIIKLVNNLLVKAIHIGASDIHIEPEEGNVRIRYRIDGVLQSVNNLPNKIKNAVISRIKILSHLDIAERRLPQDGRVRITFDKKKIDIRVSIFPGLFGEKIVLRILDKTNLQLDLTKLGFEEQDFKIFLNAIQKPFGMILVTGPTGSGKTTTLYSALSILNKQDVNIMTIEDPIEYNFQGINQGNIKENIGLTFAVALRSFLRQDPDIIMVGEIRDKETAEISVKSALTGHLVLSTIHTNDAASTIVRLINIGIEPFLISSSVVLVVAQRLVRKICSNCKEKQKISNETLFNIGLTAEQIDISCYKGKGCSCCNGTGYKGRVALFEVMPIKENIKKLILKRVSASEIKKIAIENGMLTLRQTGINKIIQGITTVEEVLKSSFED